MAQRPLWRKTGATSTTPVSIYLPPGARQIKVWADVASLLAITTGGVAPSASATDAVQTISSLGGPTGGTFTLRFGNEVTTALTFDESGGDIEAALEALSAFVAADVTDAGGPLPIDVTITFAAAYAGTPVALLVPDSSGLTGGTNPRIRVATTTEGGNPYTYVEASTQELHDLTLGSLAAGVGDRFVHIAAVTGTGNYRISAYT